MTTASKITLVRVVLIPVFMVLLLCSGGNDALRWAALGVFVVASISDFVDGYIARHYNQVTDFGKFLDPLADKLLVTACMMIFVGQAGWPAGSCSSSSRASLQSPVCASSPSAMGASSPLVGAGQDQDVLHDGRLDLDDGRDRLRHARSRRQHRHPCHDGLFRR